MTEIFTPPAHPGELLGREIARRGITIADAARLIDVKPVPLRRVITGHCRLSPEIAIRLERAGVGKAAQWAAKQAAFDFWRVEISVNFDNVQLLPPICDEHAEQ